MAAVLGGLGRLVGTELLDYVAAFGGGVLDAYLLKWNALAFLLKNIAVPVAHHMLGIGIRGLTVESVGMLGFTVATLVAYKPAPARVPPVAARARAPYAVGVGR